jgi:hypothetical protein
VATEREAQLDSARQAKAGPLHLSTADFPSLNEDCMLMLLVVPNAYELKMPIIKIVMNEVASRKCF